jgi:polyribonucleotide 5'-hydroxyl-kinase
MAASSSAVPPAESLPTNLYDLAKENELRIEIDENESISLRLIAGTAEIFGTEIAQDHVYKFAFTNVAVFTWHGCKIEVTLNKSKKMDLPKRAK